LGQEFKQKGEAENIAHAAAEHDIKVTSFRPSVIFGHGDNFFNRFALLLKISPWFFPLACPRATFAPVYIDDVTEAIAQTLNNPMSFSRRYNLCGPNTYTLQELVEYTAALLGIRQTIIPLSDMLSRIQAAIFDFVPGKPFSTDNYLSTKVDSICTENDFIALGIPVTAIEAVLPQYLSNKIHRTRYYEFRSESRRNI